MANKTIANKRITMVPKNEMTAWVGWVYFAGAMLLAVGGTQIIAGLVGVFHRSFYVVTTNGLVAFNYAAWGWISIALGVLVLLTGLGVWAGATWARVAGVFLAVLAMLDSFAFITAYPLWSLIGVVLNSFVIYALTIHGSEVAYERKN